MSLTIKSLPNFSFLKKVISSYSIFPFSLRLKYRFTQNSVDINDDFDVKIAETLKEACKLLEVDFEYVTDMDGKNCLGSANDCESFKFYF